MKAENFSLASEMLLILPSAMKELSLSTGTGKTLVACAWAYELLSQKAAEGILVLEPSRFLAGQTCAYFNKRTNMPTGKICGTTLAEAWNACPAKPLNGSTPSCRKMAGP
jgi:hypothetical protein